MGKDTTRIARAYRKRRSIREMAVLTVVVVIVLAAASCDLRDKARAKFDSPDLRAGVVARWQP